MRNQLLAFALVIVLFTSCSTVRRSTSGKDNGKIDVTFVQINDVYEIAPLSGGKEGGMARVASLKKEYQGKNPNTFLVIAGDFVSPSVFNSLQYEGKAIRGKQMIESMNAAGMDLAVFGNHEFDIKESELQDRINESNFQWISSNSFHKVNNQVIPFCKTNGLPFPKTYILRIKDADGTTAKIGFIGINLPFNKADYVSYTDPLSTAKELYQSLKDSVDAVVAITHQAIQDDEQLARELPGLAMILGGHEHDQHFEKIGKIYITKALANAKSAYVVRLKINKKKHRLKVKPELRRLDETVPLDSTTNAVVQKWNGIAESNYNSLGFDPHKVVLSAGDPLDGRETPVRSQSTGLTRLVAEGMKYALPEAEVVLYNAGSIRVDDILQMPITQYDILRSLPFGGAIRQADMKGSLLLKTLEQGQKNIGTGGYLQHNDELTQDSSGWKLNGGPIDPQRVYHVAIAEFLLSGKEANLDFLTPQNPEVVKVYPSQGGLTSDIRLAIVKYLESKQK
jgi:2',3'-cyclic-nucleotide 2'-phosphodiesterase (5'-nucleotidase family)